jgi:hypothetical protein
MLARLVEILVTCVPNDRTRRPANSTLEINGKEFNGPHTGQFRKTKQETGVAKPRNEKNIKNDERGTRASSAIARKKKMLTHNYLTRAPHTSRRTRRRRSTLVVVVVVVSAGSNLP